MYNRIVRTFAMGLDTFRETTSAIILCRFFSHIALLKVGVDNGRRGTWAETLNRNGCSPPFPRRDIVVSNELQRKRTPFSAHALHISWIFQMFLDAELHYGN